MDRDLHTQVSVLGFRFLAWTIVGSLFAYLLNIYLTFWREWPGAISAFGADGSLAAWLQVLIYLSFVALPLVLVVWYRERTLRQDYEAITAIAAYIARFAFWVVFLIGIVDALISFLRIEGLLEVFVGAELDRPPVADGFGQLHAPTPLFSVGQHRLG